MIDESRLVKNTARDITFRYKLNKILIAYFTAAENSGVDAVSSASYTEIGGTAVGRLRAVADMIRENTDGELEPDATVIEDGFTVSERDVDEVAEDVAKWLNELGY